MIIIGLTGSIGMGKTTVAGQFRRCGAMVLDSDAVVHTLLARGGDAVNAVGKHFSDVLKGGAIDRKALGKEVFADTQKLRELESILHPLVRQAQDAFIREASALGKQFVVLDIPLLFETKGEQRCDYTVVVTAPAFVQRRRVLARKGMSVDRFESILARQMPDIEKRRRADFVIQTGSGKGASLTAVRQIILRLTKKPAKKKP